MIIKPFETSRELLEMFGVIALHVITVEEVADGRIKMIDIRYFLAYDLQYLFHPRYIAVILLPYDENLRACIGYRIAQAFDVRDMAIQLHRTQTGNNDLF